MQTYYHEYCTPEFVNNRAFLLEMSFSHTFSCFEFCFSSVSFIHEIQAYVGICIRFSVPEQQQKFICIVLDLSADSCYNMERFCYVFYMNWIIQNIENAFLFTRNNIIISFRKVGA